MKITSAQIARIQAAYQESEKFHSVADLAAVVPGFGGFHAWEPDGTIYEDAESDGEDELYADHRGITNFSNSNSYVFVITDEDGDEEEIEIIITGTNSAETVNGIALTETSVAEDIAATDWVISQIN